MSHHCDARSKHQNGSVQDRRIQVGSQARKSGRLDKKRHSCGDRSNHLKHLNIERMTVNLGLVHAMPTSIKINDYDKTKQTPCHHDAWPKHQNGCGKIILLITLLCPTTKFYGPRNLEGLIYVCIIPKWCIRCTIYLSHGTCYVDIGLTLEEI